MGDHITSHTNQGHSKNGIGRLCINNRAVINDIQWVLRTGAPWQDLLSELLGSCLIYAIVGNGCPKSRKERVHMMIQEVGVDVAGKRVLWIKALSDFDMPFQLLKNLNVYYKRRFWIEYQDADKNKCGIPEDKGQIGVEVKTFAPVPTMPFKRRGVRTMKEICVKSEIAQLPLSDLRRRPLAL